MFVIFYIHLPIQLLLVRPLIKSLYSSFDGLLLKVSILNVNYNIIPIIDLSHFDES